MEEKYSSPALPAGIMAGVRIAVLMVGPFAIAKGWVSPENVDGIAVSAVTLGTGLYGLIKTFKRQKKLNQAEKMIGQPIPKP